MGHERIQPFGAAVEDAIQQAALDAYPLECCGVVTPSGFKPLPNRAEHPDQDFLISQAEQDALGEPILAVAHSHPSGDVTPSELDQQRQIDSAVPWAICPVHLDSHSGPEAGPMLWWGDSVWVNHPRPRLMQRAFRWGPTGTDGAGDCFALARDYYALHHGLMLPEVARKEAFWRHGENHFGLQWQRSGFKRISLDDIEPGDALLIPFRADVPNHAAIYIGEGGLILHQVMNQLSRREPIGRWAALQPLVLRPPVPLIVGGPALA